MLRRRAIVEVVSSIMRKRPAACHTTLSRISSFGVLESLVQLVPVNETDQPSDGHHVRTQSLKLHPRFACIIARVLMQSLQAGQTAVNYALHNSLRSVPLANFA